MADDRCKLKRQERYAAEQYILNLFVFQLFRWRQDLERSNTQLTHTANGKSSFKMACSHFEQSTLC
jgi:hypothetical protein